MESSQLREPNLCSQKLLSFRLSPLVTGSELVGDEVVGSAAILYACIRESIVDEHPKSQHL